MIQTEIVNALMAIAPETPWAVEGDSYSTIVWLNDQIPKPTEDDIKVEIDRQKEQVELARLAAIETELAKQAAIESAKAKLAKLGLTEEEAKAVIGL